MRPLPNSAPARAGARPAAPAGGHGPLGDADRPVATTLAGVLDERARRHPRRPAVFHDGRTVSYGELRDAARAVAASLLALGVRRGDRVGVLLGNEPDWLAMAFGAAWIGATCVPLNTWYKRDEIAWTLRHCGVRCFVSTDRILGQDFAGAVADLFPAMETAAQGELALEGFPELRAVAVLGDAPRGALDRDALRRLSLGVPGRVLDEALAAVRAEDIAFILYTSGSTADPKGVTLAHGGVVANGWDMGVRRRVGPDDRVWLGSPLFYALGATNALPVALTHGASLVLHGHFEAGRAIDAIERTGATVWYGTGNMSRAVLDHPDYAYRRIATLQKGSAGTMTEYKRMTLVEMRMTLACGAYGLTETYGQATVHEADDPLEVKLHTNGRALPGMEIAIVDPSSGAPLRQGETGLVLVRGHTTPGYYRNEAENARTLRTDGWFDTGDLASLDTESRLVFHARLKEVIKTGGINVSPMEVEQLIARHPGVKDAHVVGVPDPVRGQLIVAFVDTDAPLDEQAIRAFVKERAAAFKVPHRVLFRTTDALPRLASGKVAKWRLVEEAGAVVGGG